MHWNLEARRVVITGGSRGIGRSIGLAFARAGAAVSVCARGVEALEATRSDIAALGVRAHAAVCDLADAAATADYIAAAASSLGGIDILVNNATGMGLSDDEAGWGASLDVDLLSAVRATRAARPHLEQAKEACIVNITSIAGILPSARSPSYGAAKAAVIHYTTSLAAALARQRIRVNAVAPGSIEFPGGVWEQRRASDPKLYGAILERIPFGRLGVPDEVADAVLFLASPYARWITGQILTVDGGQSFPH